ncbi:hypothetical protein S40293_10387 [Stachybotrys chartarum IBT 40293]|nr:hypothetical protein S40293_10387 [Stachybotrys chartarum IBT 40293]
MCHMGNLTIASIGGKSLQQIHDSGVAGGGGGADAVLALLSWGTKLAIRSSNLHQQHDKLFKLKVGIRLVVILHREVVSCHIRPNVVRGAASPPSSRLGPAKLPWLAYTVDKRFHTDNGASWYRKGALSTYGQADQDDGRVLPGYIKANGFAIKD